mgnify:CR=1 FL=1
MGKFLGGLILGVVAVGAVFVAVPPKAIDSAKQWTETAKADVVKFFTPDKNDEAEDKNDKDNTNNENDKDNKDSAGNDNIEVTKPAPPYEESEATTYVVEQIAGYYNNQK